MELLPGETLAARLAKGPLPLGQALGVAIDIADALARRPQSRGGPPRPEARQRDAHRVGREAARLRPGQAHARRSGRRRRQSRPRLPRAPRRSRGRARSWARCRYMAPEQLEAQPADERTDLWALGAILYEMVTGRRAFEGKSDAGLVAAILDHEPAPIRLPAAARAARPRAPGAAVPREAARRTPGHGARCGRQFFAGYASQSATAGRPAAGCPAGSR